MKLQIGGGKAPLTVDLRTLYLKDLTLIGSTRQGGHVFSDLIGYIERGEIKPTVATHCALRDLT